MTNTPSAVPRLAASLVVVRIARDGVELLLLQRADKGDQNSGAWVFPGGLLDPGDRDCHAFARGLDDAAASVRLGIAQGGLDYYVAAIRECFEEAGVLLAVDERDRFVRMQGDAGVRLAALREPLYRGERTLAQLCLDHGLRLAADQLFYIAHWLTPPGLAKRFDTRFFLAVLPEEQQSMHDAVEIRDHVWLSPAQLLAPENARRLLKVTRSIIEMIGRFSDVKTLVEWAGSQRDVPMVMQRRCVDSAGPRTLMPHEPAWAEIGRLDPVGEGTAWCELRPGVTVQLSPRVLRLTHGGEVAGNCYLVGGEDAGWAVVDPGSADEAHMAALIAATSGRILWILRTSAVESPAAVALAGRTGAQVRGPADSRAEIALSGDITFRPVPDPEGDSRLAGYLLVEEKTLFTGSGPPHAAALLSGLRVAPEWIAPGQGFLIPVT
jgi:8-oxo-dGTP pyrophosphatase MutT (NUDIX family)